MRKIILIILMVSLLAVPAIAQNWVTTNQATVAWDAVTYSIDQGERLIYRCYLANAKTDPNKTNPAMIGETSDLTFLITLTEKGSYFFGVRSAVQVSEGTVWSDAAISEIAWSDNPMFAGPGGPFGLRFYPVPAVPVGIRPVTQ